MAYRLRGDESIEDGVRRIAAEQVAKAIDEVDDDRLDDSVTVHQVRKRCKKVRGLLRLARPGMKKTYAPQNKAFRDADRSLSPARDAEAVLETFDALIDVFGELIDQRRFRTIRSTFEHRNEAARQEFSMDERLGEFREFCERELEEIETWKLDGDPTESIAGGLAQTYARGRREFADALDDGGAEAFHEWRKRVKYHWYHMRILRDVWRPVVGARRDEFDRLADLLGDEHDLAVMRDLICDEPAEFAGYRTIQALFGLIERRRLELQQQAVSLGERLYAEEPKAFAARFETYINVWRRGATSGWCLSRPAR